MRLDPATPAAAVIAALDLAPHPEGGFYRETFRDPDPPGGRGAATAILFLLRGEDHNHWHRVDAAEAWLFHAGGPLVLSLSRDGHDAEAVRLGLDLSNHELPQRLVPAGWWQSAASLGSWTLVSCVVAPAFRFSGFELAPPDWFPQARRPLPRGK